MIEQVFAQAKLLAGMEEEQQLALLRVFCQAAVGTLTARLKPDVTAEDCQDDFVSAASLLALAAFSESDPAGNWEQIQLGHMTIRPNGGGTAAKCLRGQAEALMLPHCRDTFCFRGV